jgi:hypothetical protein
MDFLTVLTLISLITTCIGLYLIGEKKAVAFHIYNISLVCQMYVFYVDRKWFLIIQMLLLIGFNLYNHRKWTGALL